MSIQHKLKHELKPEESGAKALATPVRRSLKTAASCELKKDTQMKTVLTTPTN